MATQDSNLIDSTRGTEARFGGMRGYALAGICVSLAFVLRLLLDPLWGDRLPYVSFFLTLLVVMRLAGPGPVAAAAVLGIALGTWFFVAPRHSFAISNPVDQVNSAIFVLVSSVLVSISIRERRAQARELAAREQLARTGRELARLAAIVESSDDAIIGKDLEGTILSWNAGAQRLYGYPPEEVIGKSIAILQSTETLDETSRFLERVRKGEPVHHFETTRRTRDGRVVPVSLTISPVRDASGTIVGVSTIGRDISKTKKAEAERERLVADLQTALAKVKTLRGLLPICSSCKKIRDDKGYWNQIELYIRERSDASFTHGICPDCAERLYGDVLNAAPPQI
jgi:PAS domain S-box-containing protein